MRIALCQMKIEWEDKEKNKMKARTFIQEAAEQSAECIVFPEMCLTGFSMNIQNTMDQSNETISFFITIAKQYSIVIGFGWTKAGIKSKKAENHFTVISALGEILSDYTKIHPFSYAKEDQYFDSGENIVQFKLYDFMVSTFICYDLRFPEVFQAVSEKSQLIIVSANWPEKRREHWRCLLRARAIENQVYIIGVNCVGNIGDVNYDGDSCLIDPLGNVLAELSYQEGLLVYNIENDVQKYREEFPTKQDRKPNLYQKLVKVIFKQE